MKTHQIPGLEDFSWSEDRLPLKGFRSIHFSGSPQGLKDPIVSQSTTASMASMIEARNRFMETLPPQMIKVEKSQRVSKFETILEESISLAEECVASFVSSFGAVAPAPVIAVKKQPFRSTLDTIWEERMQYLVSEAADAILRPVLRLNYLENLSSQFCIDTRGASSGADLNEFDRYKLVH